MDVFYYRNSILEESPAKKYFINKFLGEDKLLIIISNKILNIAEKGFIVSPFAKNVSNYSVFEMKHSFKNIEIRLMCAFVKSELILFHAFDKPRFYNNVKKLIGL